MENLLIAALFVFLNFGLYAVFIMREQLGVSKKGSIAFFVLFTVFVAFGMMSENTNLELIRMNFNLLIMYLLGLLLFRFMFPMLLKQQGKTFPIKLKSLIKKYIISGFTVLSTVVQILILYGVLK